MRKLLILMLIIIIPYSLLFAEDETTDEIVYGTLNLKGYKIGDVTDPTITITDALSGSLEIVDGKEINITSYIDKYLGVVSTANTYNQDRTLFSYRIAGNTVGNYKLEITLSNLLNYETNEDGTQSETVAGYIETAYNLANLSYTFHGVSSNTYDGNSIKGPDPGSSIVNTTNAKPEGTGSKTLVSNFKITAKEGKTTTPITWVHRGAVSMTISSDNYNGNSSNGRTIPLGKYKAHVEVKLYAN